MIHMITKLVDMHHEVIFYMYKYSIQSIYALYAVLFLCHHCSVIFMFIFQVVKIISCMLCILFNISCYILHTIVSLVG